MADGGVVDLLSSDSEDGANDADPEVGAEIRLAEQQDGVLRDLNGVPIDPGLFLAHPLPHQRIPLPAIHTFRAWLPFPPVSKPSVSYARARGHRNLFHAYMDNDYRREMNRYRDFLTAAVAVTPFVKFGRDVPVTLKAWCFLKRPIDDFMGRRRVAGNLRPVALQTPTVPIKPDNDNLAKFIMDSMTGILYDDDAQAVDIRFLKLRDNQGTCEGRVAIEVSAFDGDWSHLMPTF